MGLFGGNSPDIDFESCFAQSARGADESINGGVSSPGDYGMWNPCDLEPRTYQRHWHRLVIPCLFACGAFGAFAVRVPDGIWFAVPILAITLLVCSLLHGGIRLTRTGIEWYVLKPGWCYRRVPWEAVRKVRVNRVLQPTVLLTLEAGRYEPWVFGTPRRDRSIEIPIRTNGYAHGERLGEAIQQHARTPLIHPLGE